MCGISGLWLDREINKELLEKVVTRMADSQRHRGPDASGIWAEPDVGIGLSHRRLAIQDLSDAGAQPMPSNSGRYIISYNGEIYNHLELRANLPRNSWRGMSDTETLLAAIEAWGVEAAVDTLRGMFAFALWDRQLRRLTLARDPVGEKPLYYGRVGDGFAFASELRALQVCSGFAADLDEASIAAFLAFSAVPGPRTIFAGIHKLLPGHIAHLNASDAKPELRQYWSVTETAFAGATSETRHMTNRAHVDRLEAVLEQVAASQMISDVPLGCFLSGGVDSSLVASLLMKVSDKPVRTFSIGFESERFNEADHAAVVAAHLGTDHTEFTLTEKEALDLIPSLSTVYDEPFADSSQIPTLMLCRLARKEVTVALTGDGGDEVFGGYNRHIVGPKMWRMMARVPSRLRAPIGRLIAGLAQGNAAEAALPQMVQRLGLPITAIEKMGKFAHVFGQAQTPEEFYRVLTQSLGATKQLMNPQTAAHQPALPDPAMIDWFGTAHWLMLADTVNYLPNDILTKVDRAAMSTSLETRAPLLDRRTIDAAWEIPSHLKIMNGTGKSILRDILYRHVPREMIERPKQGFSIPLDTWLRGGLREWAGDLLSPSGGIALAPWLDTKEINALWTEHQQKAANHGQVLWNILILLEWLQNAHHTSKN